MVGPRSDGEPQSEQPGLQFASTELVFKNTFEVTKVLNKVVQVGVVDGSFSSLCSPR